METIERLAGLEDIRQLTYTHGWGIDTSDAALVAGVSRLGAGSQHSVTNLRVEFIDDVHPNGTC